MLILYAKHEPAIDDVLKRYAPEAKRFDVQLYADKAATIKKGRFVWHSSTLPLRTDTTVTVNCFKYRLEWLD